MPKLVVASLFFPPVHSLPLASKDFSGRPRQKQPVSSMFETSRAFHPVVISLARSFQLSIVSLLTSPTSPATVLLQMLYFFLNFSSRPLEATKLEISNFSAINVASSWSMEPESGMLEFLHTVYQSHIACVAGAKRGGGTEKGKREGSACSKSLCFCVTPTNFLVIRIRLMSIKCRYTRQSERKAEPCGYAEIYLICPELTLHKYLSKREILTSGQPEI